MGLLHLSKLAEFAPGIARKNISKLPTVTEPKVWEFSAHPHLAQKSGTHIDIRLGNPVTGVAHSFVLPKVTTLPGPGERALIIPTFDHSIPYMNFTGQLTSGYGKGTVVRGRRTVAEVYHSTHSGEPGTKLRFNLYEGKHPEEFSIRLDKSGQWFLHNKTLTRERRPDIPDFKPEYKEISVDAVDAANHQQAMMPKLDGAHVIIDLKAGRSPRVFSYRTAQVSPTGLIEHTHKMPELLTAKVPKELDKTILRAEVLGVDNAGHRNEGTPISSERTAGLLNSKVWESRRKQLEDGVKLKAFPFSVVKYRGKDVEHLPYAQKREILEVVQQHIPELSPPPLIAGPAQKIELLNAIRSQKHPLTTEGIVLVDPNGSGSFVKAKFAPDWDVYAREVHPAVNAKTGEPHDRAGSIGYSWTPGGPVVGQFGGFKHDEAKDMLASPDKYIGRVAKVKASRVFKDGKELGALYQPRFKEWHMDKGDIEKGAMWGGFVDEMRKIASMEGFRKAIQGHSDDALFRMATKLRPTPGGTKTFQAVLNEQRARHLLSRGGASAAAELRSMPLTKHAFGWQGFKEGVTDEGIPLAGATIGAGVGSYLGRGHGGLTGAALGYAAGAGASLLRSKMRGEQPSTAQRVLALSGLGYGLGGLAHAGAGRALLHSKPGVLKSVFHGAEGLAPGARNVGRAHFLGGLAEEGIPALGAVGATGYALATDPHRQQG